MNARDLFVGIAFEIDEFYEFLKEHRGTFSVRIQHELKELDNLDPDLNGPEWNDHYNNIETLMRLEPLGRDLHFMSGNYIHATIGRYFPHYTEHVDEVYSFNLQWTDFCNRLDADLQARFPRLLHHDIFLNQPAEALVKSLREDMGVEDVSALIAGYMEQPLHLQIYWACKEGGPAV